ncbi:hypothetical protein ACH5RR_034231 [Cinchona calisaya]|uniref:Uncharacterized protein n=1 Tax=Cinchona calisaya TaxID=153742 RepID=A0ABD2YDW9_9GENT
MVSLKARQIMLIIWATFIATLMLMTSNVTAAVLDEAIPELNLVRHGQKGVLIVVPKANRKTPQVDAIDADISIKATKNFTVNFTAAQEIAIGNTVAWEVSIDVVVALRGVVGATATREAIVSTDSTSNIVDGNAATLGFTDSITAARAIVVNSVAFLENSNFFDMVAQNFAISSHNQVASSTNLKGSTAMLTQEKRGQDTHESSSHAFVQDFTTWDSFKVPSKNSQASFLDATSPFSSNLSLHERILYAYNSPRIPSYHDETIAVVRNLPSVAPSHFAIVRNGNGEVQVSRVISTDTL